MYNKIKIEQYWVKEKIYKENRIIVIKIKKWKKLNDKCHKTKIVKS